MQYPLLSNLQQWLWGGVDFSDNENGGPQCLGSVSGQRRVLETIIGLSVGYLCYTYGYRERRPSGAIDKASSRPHAFSPGRVLLLTALSVTYGLQAAFKIISGSAIFLLFPCHTITLLWIYVLATPASVNHKYLYRFLLHFLHGPLLAVIFPIDFVLTQPFERETYWIQHALLLFTPFYLVAHERATFPSLGAPGAADFMPWVLMSFGLWSAWHWLVMQGVSVLTMVNIGHMLCAAKTDPFDPQDYRLIAIFHQLLCTAISGRIMMGFEAMVQRRTPKGAETDNGSNREKISVD